MEKVAVLLAIDNRHPDLGMNHYIPVEQDVTGKADTIPGAGGITVAPVAFVFKDEHHLAHVSAGTLREKRLGPANAGIEIQVIERGGFLKDVPDGLLSIKEIEVSSPGES